MRAGLLHPGAMGAFLGRGVGSAGHDVVWAGNGRSTETHARATDFTDMGFVVAVARTSEMILSVCPPEAALDVARSVAATGFAGIYVDLNADSPQTVRSIADLLPRVVDGGIIGGPTTDDAVVHLAGDDASAVAAIFDPSVVVTRVLAGPLGSASALKASYAASSKAVSATLLAARAAARAAGVEDALLAEWDRTQPGLVERSNSSLARVHRKSWRFAGEMREAADFFAAYGVPAGFSQAAAETYDRLADLKDRPDDVAAHEVLDRIAKSPGRGDASRPS